MTENPTSSSADTLRSVTLDRVTTGTYVARTARGGSVTMSSTDDAHLSPIELLLAAIAGCTAVDVDTVTSRRAEPDALTVTVTAHKVHDGTGTVLRDVELTLSLRLPDDAPEGVREVAERALRVSHDRTCTVSRTVEAGTPVSVRMA
ncbi:OsmC family protein [Cellulomonas carbonis]|uniref:Oxidoreductase n=1 Tax=Cellulomonas carbonis T26 TaxID=947969 RepID=A0A0A0BLC1_9CELL|nr:OsmC family protein [Cellulomonas carbonis]KGM09313.1 oxidoreductase [Cellulomonas carbonis T26]GGC13320.1 osmotically inducible protein C [Cellulomonas carbonis]